MGEKTEQIRYKYHIFSDKVLKMYMTNRKLCILVKKAMSLDFESTQA
jgi:hypothetical protein